MKRIALLHIVFILLLMSCDETVTPYSNVLKLLTNNDTKIWVTVNIESTNETEGINCEEDDILTLTLFNHILKQPTYLLTDGFIRCDYYPTEPNKGVWRLNNAQTRIIITYGEGFNRANDLYDILELTEKKLVLRNRIESLYDLTVTYRTITYESN